MLIDSEKRQHTRIAAAYVFAVHIGEHTCVGKTRNISFGGVLARIDRGDLAPFKEGVDCQCLIQNAGKSITFDTRVIRAAGKDVALQFLQFDFEQDLFLRTLLHC